MHASDEMKWQFQRPTVLLLTWANEDGHTPYSVLWGKFCPDSGTTAYSYIELGNCQGMRQSSQCLDIKAEKYEQLQISESRIQIGWKTKKISLMSNIGLLSLMTSLPVIIFKVLVIHLLN